LSSTSAGQKKKKKPTTIEKFLEERQILASLGTSPLVTRSAAGGSPDHDRASYRTWRRPTSSKQNIDALAAGQEH